MASDLYCSRADVHRWLPSGEIAGWSRLSAAARASSDAIELDGHGLETDDEVTVRAVEGGTLPTPLAEETTYYAIRVSASRFKLAATSGGSAIDLTIDGEEIVVMKEPPYDAVIEAYSRWVDTFFPAHAVPFETPLADKFALVRMLVAQLSAKALLNLDGKSSEIVNAQELAAKAQLERFAAGMPAARGETARRTNLAISSTLTNSTDSRGWGSGSLP